MENEEIKKASKKGGFKAFFKMLYNLRGVFFSLPVAVVAAFMAYNSSQVLPEQVGLLVQANGQFQYFITRELAIAGPVLITYICVLITCFSRKVIYPWLISLFSLVLPVVLWLTNSIGM